VATVLLAGGALAAAGDPTLEALDAASGIDQLLAPRVKRVAVGADLDVQLRPGGAGRELIAAGAAHMSLYVLWVNRALHGLIEV